MRINRRSVLLGGLGTALAASPTLAQDITFFRINTGGTPGTPPISSPRPPAYRFSAAQEKAKSAVQVPKPPVQRPGVASNKGAQIQEAIQSATARLQGSRGNQAIDAAVALSRAKRAAAQR